VVVRAVALGTRDNDAALVQGQTLICCAVGLDKGVYVVVAVGSVTKAMIHTVDGMNVVCKCDWCRYHKRQRNEKGHLY